MNVLPDTFPEFRKFRQAFGIELARTISNHGRFEMNMEYSEQMGVLNVEPCPLRLMTFCVNISGVIAAFFLKLLRLGYRSGAFSEEALENAAFKVFLFGRMAGCADEIDDHIGRGRNRDTHTLACQCYLVSYRIGRKPLEIKYLTEV